MKSIKKKIVLIGCLICMISVFCTSLINYNAASYNIVKESVQRVQEASNKYAKEINGWFYAQGKIVEEMQNDLIFVGNFEEEYISEFLKYKQQSNPDVVEYYLVYSDSRFITTEGPWIPKYNVQEKDWYEKATKNEGVVFSTPYVDAQYGNMVVTAATALNVDGKMIGVVCADISLEHISNLVSNAKPVNNSYGFLIDDDLSLLIHPNVEYAFSEEKGFTKLNDALGKNVEELVQMSNGKRPKIMKDYDNSDTYILISTIECTGWDVGFSVLASEVKSPLSGMKRRNLIVAIISVFLAAIATFLMGHSITGPILESIKYIEKIANLDLVDNMSEVNLKRKDELGRMFNAFQEIINNLRGFMIKIAEASQQVAASSEELTAISSQSGIASESIAGDAIEASENSQTQLSEVLNMTATIEEISASIGEIASNSDDISNISNKTLEYSHMGKDKIRGVTLQMNNIATSTNQVKDFLVDMNDSSKKMNDIINVIQSIAEQTNLLALNAAIEAAKAGEQGKGFAVVADEVRKLAEGSQKAAEEISILIKENNIKIIKVNEAVDSGKEDVEKGIESVNMADETFEEIADLINNVNNQIVMVVSSIAEVAYGNQNLVQATNAIEDISKRVLGQVENISASSEENTASIEEIASASESLARLAQELQLDISNVKY